MFLVTRTGPADDRIHRLSCCGQVAAEVFHKVHAHQQPFFWLHAPGQQTVIEVVHHVGVIGQLKFSMTSMHINSHFSGYTHQASRRSYTVLVMLWSGGSGSFP